MPQALAWEQCFHRNKKMGRPDLSVLLVERYKLMKQIMEYQSWRPWQLFGLSNTSAIYLYGHTCDVYTDHEALLSLLNTPHPSGRLARWGLALQELNLNIHYRPGRLNKSADSLSRSPVSTEDDVSAGEVALLQPDDLMAVQEEASAKDREGALLRERDKQKTQN